MPITGEAAVPARPGQGEDCRQIGELGKVLAESRDPAELLDAWQGWHRVGAPMRARYRRFVELASKGARGMGFSDVGAMWRAGYDMPADDFAREADRIWEQVKPLYLSLHAYVRTRLSEHYGATLVPPGGKIPAHLLGNMGQGEISAGRPGAGLGYDLAGCWKPGARRPGDGQGGRALLPRSALPRCRRPSGLGRCS